jgi:hypothetical protein
MNTKSLLARILTLGLIQLSLSSGGVRLQAAPSHADLKQRVEQFGPGTELKVQLDGGGKLRGVVESIGDRSFVLNSNQDGRKEIAFEMKAGLYLREPKQGRAGEPWVC